MIQNYSHCYTAILMLLCFCYPVTAVGMKDDDPVLTKIIFDQLEVRHTDGHDLISADIEGWIGKDLHKFWFKNDFESSGGETEENEWQFLYNRAVDANWDFQIGWRKDIRPKPQRDWLVIGFQGTAPYELEVETALFIGERGQTGIRLEAEYEWLLTQRWLLVPDMELNAHTRNDRASGTGAGFSDLELGLRLQYIINPQIVPYIGLNWTRQFDKTADFQEDDEPTDDVQWVSGIHFWF